MRAFGGEVHRRRIALNMTREMLAKRAGLSARHLGDIERGQLPRGLSLDAAFRIARAMGTDIPDLVGGYKGLSPEEMDTARLISTLPPSSKSAFLDLVRAFSDAWRKEAA